MLPELTAAYAQRLLADFDANSAPEAHVRCDQRSVNLTFYVNEHTTNLIKLNRLRTVAQEWTGFPPAEVWFTVVSVGDPDCDDLAEYEVIWEAQKS